MPFDDCEGLIPTHRRHMHDICLSPKSGRAGRTEAAEGGGAIVGAYRNAVGNLATNGAGPKIRTFPSMGFVQVTGM